MKNDFIIFSFLPLQNSCDKNKYSLSLFSLFLFYSQPCVLFTNHINSREKNGENETNKQK